LLRSVIEDQLRHPFSKGSILVNREQFRDHSPVQRVQVIKIKIPVEIAEVKKCPFRRSDIDTFFPEDAAGIDKDGALHFSVNKCLSADINSPAQITYRGHCRIILKDYPGPLKNILQ